MHESPLQQAATLTQEPVDRVQADKPKSIHRPTVEPTQLQFPVKALTVQTRLAAQILPEKQSPVKEQELPSALLPPLLLLPPPVPAPQALTNAINNRPANR
ncbi:MAG: hypothetical protein A2979_04115 [Deltaproteobacteria bacterium RIFCSPLOWO2_01_FULL_45_74]|nr:MAG: hypothetical protein A2712_06345 [Deltaproteobacteria bacterium RIFCSPHIGHO2_01_FULL_43_49]OGQ33173.1 MAG: hypothetical protein A2979_04115 [Deltaproteobacteria bacterium RIFCSPLOWO2_01_FULL_45_74]